MKKLGLLFFLPVSVILASCNVANDADYDAMAQDMCGCINKSSKGVSDGFKEAIIKAEKEGTDPEAAMQAAMMKDPERGMADAQALMNLQQEMTGCSQELEKKYDKVYTTESEDEVIKRILKTLKGKDGCEFVYALLKMGSEMK